MPLDCPSTLSPRRVVIKLLKMKWIKNIHEVLIQMKWIKNSHQVIKDEVDKKYPSRWSSGKDKDKKYPSSFNSVEMDKKYPSSY